MFRVKYICAFFFFLAFSLKSQFYNLPSDYSFSLLTEKNLAKKDSSLHSGMKPYIPFFSQTYQHQEDTHKVFKYIKDDPALETVFYKHLIRIEPKKENFFLRLDPLFNLETGRDILDTLNRRLYTNTRGFYGSGSIGKDFYFETLFAENQSVFPNYIANSNNASQVIPGQGRWKTFNVIGYDYAFSSGFFSYQPFRNLNIQAGHGKQKIGHGYRSLLLSDNAFNYPYIRITQQWFKGRVQYTNIYASLMNLVQASKVINPNTERLFQKKAAAFQYLSINLTKSFNLSFFQGMIWQAGDDKNRQHLDWQYFNPVIYTNLFSYGLNHKNNILVGVDAEWKLTTKLSLYGQGMADDLSGSDSLGNHYGWQGGLRYFDALGIKNFFLQFEYNSVSRNSYTSPPKTTSDQSFSHYNQTMAFTPLYGEEIVAVADYKKNRFFIHGRFSKQVKKSGVTSDHAVDYLNLRLGYVINPAYNLNIALGVIYRNQNFYKFKALNNETNYIFLSFRTSLYNLYYDF